MVVRLELLLVAKPRLLDLFCGAGGAAMGYHRAGFEVVGVDIRPQPRYPFEFIQADAMEFPLDGFDAIHASPPCQAFVTLSNRWRGRSDVTDAHPDLIAPTRERLLAAGVPYVIENVEAAPLLTVLRLCGSSFGLGVRRHRKFESNVMLIGPGCQHQGQDIAGVYGQHPDGGRLWTRAAGGGVHRRAATLTEGQERMGIPWMEWRELTQAIPPAYTEFIGGELMRVLL